MDPASRVAASQAKADGNDYKTLADHIDGRYTITYGTLEYKTSSKDATDISLAAEYETEQDAEGDGHAEGGNQGRDLDALGKGKGKGKGWPVNNGRCNVCNGEGHFARNCPSAQGADGKATGTEECYGCYGKGHTKVKCPTANPSLKGDKGGGKGWEGKGAQSWGGKAQKGGGGKGGYGGGKGKGYGKGKGSGLYEIDLMGGNGAW